MREMEKKRGIFCEREGVHTHLSESDRDREEN